MYKYINYSDPVDSFFVVVVVVVVVFLIIILPLHETIFMEFTCLPWLSAGFVYICIRFSFVIVVLWLCRCVPVCVCVSDVGRGGGRDETEADLTQFGGAGWQLATRIRSLVPPGIERAKSIKTEIGNEFVDGRGGESEYFEASWPKSKANWNIGPNLKENSTKLDVGGEKRGRGRKSTQNLLKSNQIWQKTFKKL